MSLTIEELHTKIEESIHLIVDEIGDFSPFLLCVTPDEIIHPFPLAQALSQMPKQAVAALCQNLVRSSGARMAATVLEAELSEVPIGAQKLPATGDQKRDVLIVSIQTPTGGKCWVYDIEILEGGTRRLKDPIIPENNFWNRFDLYPNEGG